MGDRSIVEGIFRDMHHSENTTAIDPQAAVQVVQATPRGV
jgi:hypothetical protein